MAGKTVKLSDDPLWYKDAIIYQVHVKSFCDSNGDGIGDFPGLTQKLPYLESLGISALWVLPFYPSPLRDDGYDIADYYTVHPQYGTLRDFKEFLKEAHNRGIRVITELVINHTSDQHEWFQRARQAPPGSKEREFYVWSDSPKKYQEARIIFKDFESSNWSWDATANAYYWHRFYSHQPDLNYDSPHLQKELFRIADFWFGLGVDGMRLDAIPYLFEREGTNCENLPETYEFLKKFRSHVDGKFKNKMLLAEANQWPEDAVKYFGDGDACNMAFHFPIMPRMFMSLQMEERFPVVDILDQTPQIPDNAQWAIFLRNHDELTLEMVTDEERDYMYRVYAKDPKTKINLGIRRRLLPLLGNNRKKVELLNILLFSLPGSPIIYYGDEIGMGDNYYLGDRNGVRTPMQWSSDKNAGFSKTNPQRLYLPVIIDPEYHYEAINVENQESNLSSLLWWMRRVISMRKNYKSFSRGTIEFLSPDNSKILVFLRKYEDEIMLVVANLSRFTQVVDLDLEEYAGYVPMEIFSQNKFPGIKKHPYTITLCSHDHYWLLLKPAEEVNAPEADNVFPVIQVQVDWRNLFDGSTRGTFEEKILPRYIKKCRWFRQKTNTIRKAAIQERLTFPEFDGYFLLLKIQYYDGTPETYLMFLSYVPKADAGDLLHECPQSIIAEVHTSDEEGYIYDAIYNAQNRDVLLQLLKQKRRAKSTGGEIVFSPGKGLKNASKKSIGELTSHLIKAEQSNSSIIYGENYILKLYRKLEEGMNPDLEMTQYLTEVRKVEHTTSFMGAIEYRPHNAEPMLMGLLSSYVPNQGDAWSFTLDHLNRFYENLLSARETLKKVPKTRTHSLLETDEVLLEKMRDWIEEFYLEMVKLLAHRTREMHDALSQPVNSPDFSPENFSTLYQRSLYQSMRAQLRKVFQLLKKNLKKLPKDVRRDASSVLSSEKDIMKNMAQIYQKRLPTQKFRIHGDYHLGQVLFTGKDFVIIDFEGEPIRALSERRLKASPFKDLTGILRSFHYAAFTALFLRPSVRSEDRELLEPWAEVWYYTVSQFFLRAYLEGPGESSYIPKETPDLQVLIQSFLLDKAIYELNYELNNRPDWVVIPLKGIRNILRAEKSAKKK